MVAQLEQMLRAAAHPIGTPLKAKDAWPVPAAFHAYSYYSNGAAGFGVVFQHARAAVLEMVGIQVQGHDYRPHVSWDWKAVTGRVVKITTADVELDGVHLVEQRRHELQVLAAIAGPQARHRNYDNRWRGYGRPYGDLSPQQLLQAVYADVLLVRAGLQ